MKWRRCGSAELWLVCGFSSRTGNSAATCGSYAPWWRGGNSEVFGGVAPVDAGINVLSVQQRLLSADAANASTPGFRAQVLNVGAGVASVLQGGAATVETMPLTQGAGGNGVSLDVLMAQTAETQQWYAADAKLAQMAYGRLAGAIGGQTVV